MRFLLSLLLFTTAIGCGDDTSSTDAAVDTSGLDSSGSDTGGDSSTIDVEGTDAREPQDAGEDVVPSGQVSLLVAYGHAARTLTSCDDGRSWIAEHSFEEDGHDHSEYAALGRMAYGDGKFIGCAGWGNPTRIVLSENGIDWEDLGDEAFLDEDGETLRPRQGCSGIAYDGSQWAFVAGGRVYSSADGRAWQRLPDRVPGSGELRAVGGGNGLILVPRDDLQISRDGGRTWTTPTGYDSECTSRIQRGGRILVVGDTVIVSGQSGTACTSTDGGETFVSGPIGEGSVAFIDHDGEQFVAATGRGQMHVSSDGIEWTGRDHDADVQFAALAGTPEGALVGVDRTGNMFLRSEDGTAFTAATSDSTDDDRIWTIVRGAGTASESCPSR